VPISPVDRAGAYIDSSPLAWPSPLKGLVGVHDFPFEACSGFTHVTARPVAQPPYNGLCHEASTRSVTRPCRSSATRPIDILSGWILPPLVIRAFGAHLSDQIGGCIVARLLVRPYMSGIADRKSAAQNITSIHWVPHLFGRKRHMMRPFALEIAAGDFADRSSHPISVPVIAPHQCIGRHLNSQRPSP
jgi:hypothetical protein